MKLSLEESTDTPGRGGIRPRDVHLLMVNFRAARWRESSSNKIPVVLAGWAAHPLHQLEAELLRLAGQAVKDQSLSQADVRTWRLRYGVGQPPASRFDCGRLLELSESGVDARVRRVERALAGRLRPLPGAPATLTGIDIQPDPWPSWGLRNAFVEALSELAGAYRGHELLGLAVYEVAMDLGVPLKPDMRERHVPRPYRQRRHQLRQRAGRLVGFHQQRLSAEQPRPVTAPLLLAAGRSAVGQRIAACEGLVAASQLESWSAALISGKRIALDNVVELHARIDALLIAGGHAAAPLIDLALAGLSRHFEKPDPRCFSDAQRLASMVAAQRAQILRDNRDLDVANLYQWVRRLEHPSRLHVLHVQRDLANVLRAHGLIGRANNLYERGRSGAGALKLPAEGILLERSAQLVGGAAARMDLFSSREGAERSRSLEQDLERSRRACADHPLPAIQREFRQIERRRLEASLVRHRLGAENLGEMLVRLRRTECTRRDTPLVALQWSRTHMEAAMYLRDEELLWWARAQAAEIDRGWPYYTNVANEVLAVEREAIRRGFMPDAGLQPMTSPLLEPKRAE
jgi:hypothetical protein